MTCAEVRHSPMLHAALQWLLMWDVHTAAALERWQQSAGTFTRDWMTALGEAEALVALATLAHDNPTRSFPDITDCTRAAFEATALAHPFLPEATRVANDVTVGPPGTFLLITGSNMSGKSTILRAIGINAVLTQTGGPVRAADLRMPLLSVYTSIRIRDSLEEGLSLFMAELQRLKMLLDTADHHPTNRNVLYLIDEILFGTNTAERQIAARTIIARLIQAGAIGAITTHDLSLDAHESLASTARQVHFTEHFDRSTEGKLAMNFDFRLRPDPQHPPTPSACSR